MLGIRDIIVLTVILGSLPFCFAFPFYGILVWTVLSFLNPEKFAWVANQLPVSMAVAIPTLAGFVLFSRGTSRLFRRDVFMLAVLWLWFTATTLNSVHDAMFAEKAASAWYYWNMVSKILMMTAVTIGIVDTWDRLRWLVLVIAGSFGFLVLKTLPIMILSGGASRVYGPPNSMIADNNDFGLALNMALPFFFFLAKTESNRRMRWLMGLLFLATIPAILFTYSRGALVGLVAVLLCMMLQAKQKLILLPVAVLVFVFAAFLTPQSWRDRMSTQNALDASARSRLNAWSFSWALAKDNPLMGGGFDAFTPALFARYAPTAKDVHGPHSIYFGVLAEHGFIGLFLYLALIASCFAALHRTKRIARFRVDERGANYANMFRFSLVGFLASGAFLGRAYFDLFFAIVACITILRQISAAEWTGAAHLDLQDPTTVIDADQLASKDAVL